MSNGWMNHPKYGRVYQPDLAQAGTNLHIKYDAWYGEEYDTLNRLIDQVQYAAMRSVLNDLREVLDPSVDPRVRFVVKAIDAMQGQIDDHQHGPDKEED